MENTKRAQLMSILRLIGVASAIIGVFVVLIWIGEKQDGNVHQPSPVNNEVTAIDHAKGPDTASLTLIEYADFQCPTCAAFAPVVQQLSDTYANDLRVVYRYFPLQTIHPNATLAAQAAEAAGRQGKFWEMHDLLFVHQKDWSATKDPRDQFAGYAAELQLNIDQFKADVESKDVKDRVAADSRSGSAAGISGTPTFYLNGEAIENPRGLEAFKAVIDAKLPDKSQE